ncbi:MAG: hypothetical protein EOO01_32965, partial [Chitinophagaceae bacterium]
MPYNLKRIHPCYRGGVLISCGRDVQENCLLWAYYMNLKEAIIIIEDDKDDQEILHSVMEELGVTRPVVFFDDCEVAYTYFLS